MIVQHVNETRNFKGSIRYEAKCLGENLSKFETVLVAFTYIRIFDITIPVSDYLQTPGLDVLQAWRMINDSKQRFARASTPTLKTAGYAGYRKSEVGTRNLIFIPIILGITGT